MIIKNGAPVKDRKGWVHFGAGQLRKFEYLKYLKEQKEKVKTEKKKIREVKKEEKKKVEHKKEEAKAKSYGVFIPDYGVKEVVRITETINTEILKGSSLLSVALSVEMSREVLFSFLNKYYKVNSFTSYKKGLISRHREVKMPWGIKKQRDVRSYIRVPFSSYKARIEGHADPIVSTEDKSYQSRWYPKTEPGQSFSKNILIVPNRTLQPIKRIRIAAHSFLTAGEWHNGRLLLTASCKLAEKALDKYLTVEGGIIISKKFATKQNLGLGDKILGIYGLKGIVSEIRKQAVDIVINKNQVWGAKMSRLCGGAVLDLQDNKIQVFYQPEHKIQISIPKGSEPKVRFSPDLVPFLGYYLSSKELTILQGENKKRFQDILYMLNLEFVNKKGYLYLIPKRTQPKERKNGKLYPFNQVYWGKNKWEDGLTREKVKMGVAGLMYPFILENIWVPDWFIKENKYVTEKRKDGKVVCRETHDIKFVENIKNSPENIYLGGLCARFVYKYLFTTVNESLSYLTAVAKNGRADEILLNKADCERVGIKNKDWVLVFRYPIVDRLNIQKMQVKISEIPHTTIGINIESIRLMHGDFDGDPLYLFKIPQTFDFAKAFKVSKLTYRTERKDILKEIKENDAVQLPKDEREVKIAQREAFIRMKVEEGSWGKTKIRTLGVKLVNTKTGHLRTDTELIEEAQRIHENLNNSGGKAEKIGTATKWMWLGSADVKEKDIKCVASLEVIKDRADKKSEQKYKKSLKTLNKYKEKIKTITLADGKKVVSWQTRAFEKLISTGTFKKDANVKAFPNLSRLKEAPLIRARTPYAKFILCLCRHVE